MRKKARGTIFLMVLMVMPIFLQACGEPATDFDVVSLNIEPQTITVGGKATIKVEIRNSGTRVETYNVPLMVNGVADNRKSVTLAPDATESITFVLTKSRAGNYKISIGNKESTLTVQKPLPPDFHLSDLTIHPTEVFTGENIVITAKIANTGGTQGGYTAELKVDGVTSQTEKLCMPAGTDCTLVFKVSRGLPGTYKVALGELTGQFVVTEQLKSIPLDNLSPPTTPSSNRCRSGG